jgi:hypothetical protein
MYYDTHHRFLCQIEPAAHGARIVLLFCSAESARQVSLDNPIVVAPLLSDPHSAQVLKSHTLHALKVRRCVGQ